MSADHPVAARRLVLNPSRCVECVQYFYCDRTLPARHEHDHFPIPDRFGGEVTVPSCLDCHDLKDRMDLASWPVTRILEAFAAMPPEARLLAAKLVGLIQDAEHQL